MGAKLEGTDPFECVRESFDGYHGPDDGISPLLFSDYTTASRVLLLTAHVAATLWYRSLHAFLRPASWSNSEPGFLPDSKLEGIERTKRLFRLAMKGVLPDVVNERQDKLGHSVPLKNWLRIELEVESVRGGHADT